MRIVRYTVAAAVALAGIAAAQPENGPPPRPGAERSADQGRPRGGREELGRERQNPRDGDGMPEERSPRDDGPPMREDGPGGAPGRWARGDGAVRLRDLPPEARRRIIQWLREMPPEARQLLRGRGQAGDRGRAGPMDRESGRERPRRPQDRSDRPPQAGRGGARPVGPGRPRGEDAGPWERRGDEPGTARPRDARPPRDRRPDRDAQGARGGDGDRPGDGRGERDDGDGQGRDDGPGPRQDDRPLPPAHRGGRARGPSADSRPDDGSPNADGLRGWREARNDDATDGATNEDGDGDQPPHGRDPADRDDPRASDRADPHANDDVFQWFGDNGQGSRDDRDAPPRARRNEDR